jgi:hypothetical protein
MERCPYPERFWTYLPGSPVKEPSPETLRASERNAPFLEPLSSISQKSLVGEPPSRFPSGAPEERDDHLQSLFSQYSRVPSKGALCLFSYPACKALAPYFHLRPVRLCRIRPHYLINRMILGGGGDEWRVLNIKRFDFLYNLCLKHFLFKEEFG